MAFKGLKINISFYVIVPIFLSMILIHTVVDSFFQKAILNEKYDMVFSLIEDVEKQIAGKNGRIGYWTSSEALMTYLHSFGIRGGLIVAKDDSKIHLKKSLSLFSKRLLTLAAQTLQTGEIQKQIFQVAGAEGSGSYLLVCAPINYNSRLVASIGLALDVTGITRTLHSIQRLAWIYILINTVLFSCIAIYKIYKLIVRPLHVIAERADSYRDDQDFFTVDRADDEFGKLSKALNRMLNRIAADREKLSESVEALESMNSVLRQAQSDMIRAEKLTSIGRLASGIAHEIGNPIGIIAGYLELLRRSDISGKESQDYLDRAESELQRINQIIRQLLELSRPNCQVQQSVCVHEILQDFSEMLCLQPLTAHVNIALDLRAENDCVWADPNQLRQVFLNLVMNAIDAIDSESRLGPGKGSIKLSTSQTIRDGISFLETQVIDDGPGIPDDILKNIFDPFFTTKDPGKGTGLGLSVCFTIVESMGGSIHVNSQVHVGTTFTIQLPVLNDSV